MDRADSVRQYYLTHFDELPLDKQFHFAGRLATWEMNQECLAHLTKLKPQILPPAVSAEALLTNLVQHPPEAKINAAQSRAIYFARYPQLRGLMLGMFRVRHARDIYKTDLRQALLKITPHATLRKLAEQLSNDHDALRTLSTYAINYLYLLDVLFPGQYDDLLHAESFFTLGDAYDLANPEAIQLLIYLYTHCIIGDSNFYVRAVNPDRTATYRRMLERLEQLIDQNFTLINLDNKLEFLVCCNIIGYAAPTLAARIQHESSLSISDEGTFLIDRHNKFMQSDKKSFIDSEHRNVLFIMSTSPYHGTTARQIAR